MKSWRTTLGGALAATGTFMWGIPIALVAMKFAVPDLVITICIISGIVLNAGGVFFNGLSGRDNGVPSAAIPEAAQEEARIKGDTTIIDK